MTGLGEMLVGKHLDLRPDLRFWQTLYLYSAYVLQPA